MLLRIVAIIFPIFAIIAAGWLYARYRRNLSGDAGGIDMSFANQLNMEIFVPALVFAALLFVPLALAMTLK
jgi:predicted permease